MRSLSKLSSLKNQYLDDGYYLFYYGFSPRSSNVSQKRNIDETLAKEFLLSYLGFDVIGASFAQIGKRGGGEDKSEEKATGIFDPTDFKYHLEFLNNKDHSRAKQNNYTKQTNYLKNISDNMSNDSSRAITELKK